MDAAIAVIMNPLLALYTKFQGSSCLTHVGTEGSGSGRGGLFATSEIVTARRQRRLFLFRRGKSL
jgi:hypothetical protein